MIRFEHRNQPVIGIPAFARRMLRSLGIASLFIGGALFIGMIGYHILEGLDWTDSFLNASMILGGMGPVATLQSEAGKIFAGCYALFSGLAFLVFAGLIFSPIAHRILHRFHYEADQDEKSQS